MNDQHNDPEALDLQAYIRPIWRRKLLVLLITAVAAAATYIVSSREAKQYVSTTSVYVKSPDPTLNITGSGVAASQVQIADIVQLMLSDQVSSAVVRQIGAAAAAGSSVSVSAVPDTDFIDVTGTSSNPVIAARLANTTVSVYLATRRRAVAAEARDDEAAARATLVTLPRSSNSIVLAQRQTIIYQIEQYHEIALNPDAGAVAVNPAIVPSLPVSPRPARDAIFGGAIGFVLALLIAFALELLDRKLARVATLATMYDVPVLAVLPHVANPTPTGVENRASVPSEFLEELRSLRVMLKLERRGPTEPRTILITSAMPREGKSTITRDLSLVYAEAGQSVLVIDADLRRPSMERLFGLDCETGLAHVLRGETSLANAVAHVPVVISRPAPSWPSRRNGNGASAGANGASAGGAEATAGTIDVLTHGERLDSPLGLLSSPRMFALLRQAAESYDIVLLDTAPVLSVVDTVPLLAAVDSVLLVARLGQTTRDAATRFNELIARLPDVKFAGVIANDRREKLDDEGYGSYGRYGYKYYGAETAPRVRRESKRATTGPR
jgi:succinoglycan biosynthesis transport protein ExoP